MTNPPWRLASLDEETLSLDKCDIVIDRVCLNYERPEYKLANINVVSPVGCFTLAELSADDLVDIAQLLLEFALMLQNEEVRE